MTAIPNDRMHSAVSWAAVTPSDTAIIENVPVGLYVGGAGNVAVKATDALSASAVTFTAVPAGTILPIQPRMVMSTGTTATDIVALYNT